MNIHTEWKKWKNLGENRAFFTHFFYSQWKFPVPEKFTFIYIHWAVCPRSNINTFFQLSVNNLIQARFMCARIESLEITKIAVPLGTLLPETIFTVEHRITHRAGANYLVVKFHRGNLLYHPYTLLTWIPTLVV